MLAAVLVATFNDADASPPTVPGTADAAPATGPAVTVATAPDETPPAIAPEIMVADERIAQPAAAKRPCAAMAAAVSIVSIDELRPPEPSTVNANVCTAAASSSSSSGCCCCPTPPTPAAVVGDGGYSGCAAPAPAAAAAAADDDDVEEEEDVGGEDEEREEDSPNLGTRLLVGWWEGGVVGVVVLGEFELEKNPADSNVMVAWSIARKYSLTSGTGSIIPSCTLWFRYRSTFRNVSSSTRSKGSCGGRQIALRQAPKVCGYDTVILLFWHAPCSMRSNLWHASLKRLVASLSSVVAATAASILAKSAP